MVNFMVNYWHGMHHGNSIGHMRSNLDSEKTLRDSGITESIVVADMGCGSGFFTIPIASIVGQKGKVYAIDVDEEALNYLREEVKKRNLDKIVEVIQSDFMKTPIQNNSVDAIFLANVFHGINNKADFFKEAKRIAKPEAILIDIDWDKVDTIQGPPYYMRISLEEAKEIFSRNGFEIVKTFDAGPNHYGLVFKLADK